MARRDIPGTDNGMGRPYYGHTLDECIDHSQSSWCRCGKRAKWHWNDDKGDAVLQCHACFEVAMAVRAMANLQEGAK